MFAYLMAPALHKQCERLVLALILMGLSACNMPVPQQATATPDVTATPIPHCSPFTNCHTPAAHIGLFVSDKNQLHSTLMAVHLAVCGVCLKLFMMAPLTPATLYPNR